jgi:hypothetical protein
MEDLLSRHHISPFVWRIVGKLSEPAAVVQMAYYRPLVCTIVESAIIMLPWNGIICGPVWSRFRSRVLHLPRSVHHVAEPYHWHRPTAICGDNHGDARQREEDPRDVGNTEL